MDMSIDESDPPKVEVDGVCAIQWSGPYLNFQQVIPANALVVHLMICIVSITTALIFNKCEPVAWMSLDVQTQYWRKPTIDLKRFLELECHSEQGDHSFMEVRLASK